jgi:hypothetical protein
VGRSLELGHAAPGRHPRDGVGTHDHRCVTLGLG